MAKTHAHKTDNERRRKQTRGKTRSRFKIKKEKKMNLGFLHPRVAFFYYFFFNISSFLSLLFFTSFFCCLSSCTRRRHFLSKVLVHYCFLVFPRTGKYMSPDLSYFVNLTSSCSLILSNSTCPSVCCLLHSILWKIFLLSFTLICCLTSYEF